MGVTVERPKKKRKLFVEDRSFFGDESLTYPEVDQRTIDGDVLKLKPLTKPKLKNRIIKSVQREKYGKDNSKIAENVITVGSNKCKFDKAGKISLSEGNSIFSAHIEDQSVGNNPLSLHNPKMGKKKRKSRDSVAVETPEPKKNVTENLNAAADSDNDDEQLDDNSTIIDVVGVSLEDAKDPADATGGSDLSNMSGHHEEWHFSSPDNSVNESRASSHDEDDSDHSAEIQSEKKREFVHRFLSDAISTLGMGEEFLNDTSDSDSSDDITEAADLISSHKKKQTKNLNSASKNTDFKKAKNLKTKHKFEATSSLSSGQKWLLKQMSPLKNCLSPANPEGRCRSPVNSPCSSEESLQVLQHIKPPNKTTIYEKRKKGEREMKEDKKKKRKLKSKHTEKDKKEKRAKKKEKGLKLQQLAPEDTTSLGHVCASNDSTGNLNRKDQEDVNKSVKSTNQAQCHKKVNVVVQLTNDEILHQSPIRECAENEEISSNQLQIPDLRVNRSKTKKKKKKDCEVAYSESLEQLVERASSSLKNCGSSSTNDYSPDLFDEDTNIVTGVDESCPENVFSLELQEDSNPVEETVRKKKKKRKGTESTGSNEYLSNLFKNQKDESTPEESSSSHTMPSNDSRKPHKLPRDKRKSVKNVATNRSPESIDSCSPWHRLTHDSNGSFTAQSAELFNISSQASQPHPDPQNILRPHTNRQGTKHGCLVSNSEGTVTSPAVLGLSAISPISSLENSSRAELVSKPRSSKQSLKVQSSQNTFKPREKSQSASKLSKCIPKQQRLAEKIGKKEKHVPKQGSVKCTRCRLWFQNEVSMALHKCDQVKKNRTIEEPHRTKYATHVCDICGKAYVYKGSLKFHMNSYHLDLRPYQCDECPMSFSVKQTLNVHKRVHSDTLPFECCICSKQARTMCNLHHHYSKLHRLTPNYPCASCPHKNVSFYFERDLIEHMERHHKNSTVRTVQSL